MSLFYKFQYLFGITPWEKMSTLPVGEQTVALLEREEGGKLRHHSRTQEQVWTVGREITTVATGDATLLMYLMYRFSPGRRRSLPRGISRKEIEIAWREWIITGEEAIVLTGLPRLVQKATPRFYCLHRK